MKKLSKEQKTLLDKITKELETYGKHYLFEPRNKKTMELMKSQINEMISKFAPYQDKVENYIDVKVDPKDNNIIHIFPKRNAPLWITELFLKINGRKIWNNLN